LYTRFLRRRTIRTPPSASSDFRWLTLAHAAMTFAREAQVVVVGWQVYEITKDPLSLGLIGLAEGLPLLGFALPARE
jgi:hypothetical protein